MSHDGLALRAQRETAYQTLVGRGAVASGPPSQRGKAAGMGMGWHWDGGDGIGEP